MKMRNLYLILILCCFIFSYAVENTIYKIEIKGDIDNGLPPYIKRVIKEAEKNSADYIIVEINTFGGRVDAATAIKDAILNTKIPTIAFVNKRAISAGSLIALSCNKIVMASGSSMGATTVVNQEGEKQSEKSQSYMRAEMASTAEKNGRNSMIAQAMVDEDIEIEGLTPKGKLLTLTANDALKYQMCDTILSSEKEIFTYLKAEQPVVITATPNYAENIVRFLTNPVVSSLLMSLGFLGLIFEIKTPGWGVGGTVGLIALGLFFGGHYIVNMVGHLELILFFAGVALLLFEIFVIPGFGITGILGITAIMSSFFMTMLGHFPSGNDFLNAGAAVSFALMLTTVGLFILVKYLPQTSFLDKIMVKDQLKTHSGVGGSSINYPQIGETGIAHSDLRPSGKAIISGVEFHVVSNSDFIAKGEEIAVYAVEGNKITVHKVV